MSNSYYNHASYPAPNAPGSSAAMRGELDLLEAAFAKLPTLAGNGYKVAMVMPNESGMVATSELQQLAVTLSTIDNSPIGATTASTGKFTTLQATGAVLLGSQVTIGGGTINGTTIGGTTPAAGYFTSVSSSAGFVGNLTGNVTGNVTGNLTGSVSGNVTVSSGTSTFNNVTINGTLDMAAGTTGTITGLADPTGSTDAAHKSYVDTQRDTRLAKTGGTLTGALAMSGYRVTGLADPINAQDAATKQYVDSAIEGLDIKPSVKAATTGSIALSGPQTIDSVSVAIGDRVLVKNQGDPTQNGIYIVALGAWTRSKDTDAWSKLPGAFTFVEDGSINHDSGWVCTVGITGSIGVNNVTFEQFSGTGQITAGGGMTKTGNKFDVVTASSSRIVINEDSIDLAFTGVTAGTYKSVTVDGYGRVTAATNPTTLAGFGILDAYTSSYTDTLLSAKVNISGSNMTGALGMGGNRIQSVGAPVNSGDATNKSYVDAILGSATVAEDSAAAAALSEANAANSATAAYNSQTAAASSASAAAASYDSFDDRYLGSKGVDPTVDNDGNALLTGALYWNSGSDQMRVYNGSAWEPTYLPTGAYLWVSNNLSDLGDATTARTNLGIGNVENKSSSTIRGELTSGDVTTALGFTPPANTGTGASGTWNISISGNAATATKLASVGTTFNGTYPMVINASGVLYSHGSVTFNGTTGELTATSFSGSLSGNASSATTAAGLSNTTWARVTTSYGYIDFGPANTSYAHIYTDRPSFYLNKPLYVNAGELALSSGNYNYYAPTLTGTGASGTWGISISGNAATVSNGVYTNTAQTISGAKTFTGGITLGSTTTWNPGQNFSLTPTANNHEWSFDLHKGSFTGTYWQVWEDTKLTLLKVDADSGKVSAPYNFVGALEGNASTATKLATDRTIQGVTFNGSQNITVATASTGIGVSGTAISIASAYSPNTAYEMPVVDLNTYQTAGFYYQNSNADTSTANNYPIAQAGSLLIQKSAGVTQTYITYGTSDTTMWFRSFYSSVWGSWRKVIDSANYNSYAPSLTGTGASGSWDISVTGNAATATKFETDRTINGVIFNGTANITVADSTKLPTTGGTLTGTLTFNNSTTTKIALNDSSAYWLATSTNWGIYWDTTNNTVEFHGAGTSRAEIDLDNGNFVATGNITAYSDERIKKDWDVLPTNFLERLAEVKSGTYTRIDTGERQAGTSAQDWRNLLPEVVSEMDDEQKTLSLAYGNAALVSSVELAKEVVVLRKKVSRLEALIGKLIGE